MSAFLYIYMQKDMHADVGKNSKPCAPRDDLLASCLQLPTPFWTSGHVCALKPQPTCLADAYRQLDRRIGDCFSCGVGSR